MLEKGERVGAILGAKNGVVEFLGYGVYSGEDIPVGAIGFLAEAAIEAGLKNPKITLDSGKVVWGCECWWGSEESVKKKLKGQKVVDIDVDEMREKWFAQQEE